MKSKKTSFVLYHDYKDQVDELNDEQAGKLFKMILDYVNGVDVVPDNQLLKLVFLPIQKSLKRDLQKYENKLEARSYAGTLGNLKKYTPDIYEQYKSGKIDITEAQELSNARKLRKSEISETKIADSVSGNGSGTVNKTVNKTVDVDEDAEKVTIAAARDLFLKNDEILKAFTHSYNLKKRKDIYKLLDDFDLHLGRKGIKEKTPQDYIDHFDNYLKKGNNKNLNKSNLGGPLPDSYESGKLPRVETLNSSDNIPVG